MAEMGKFQFVPTAGGNQLVPWEEIPEDVVNQMEEAANLLLSSSGRIHATFDNKEQKDLFSQYATSWGKLRPAGEITFRWSPTKGNQPHEGDFTLKRVVAPSGSNDTPPAE